MPSATARSRDRWIATRPDWVAEVSLAGALSSIRPLGTWWAAVPEAHLPDHDGARACMAAHWVESWSDRLQEIVFIGAGIDWPALKARLDAALLPDHRASGPQALPDLPDALPTWRAEPAARASTTAPSALRPRRRRHARGASGAARARQCKPPSVPATTSPTFAPISPTGPASMAAPLRRN